MDRPALNSIEINHLDKRTPWAASLWSALMPGLGQVYIHRIPSALFSMSWFIVMAYKAKLLPAIHYTMLGQFDQVKAFYSNPESSHWLLNIPCIYFFAVYEPYVNAIEDNKLFRR